MGGLALAAVVVSGCSTPPPPPPGPQGRQNGGGNPFPPQFMRVHPLSHVALAADGKPEVICHIDFRDQVGDSVKAVGPLTMRLFGPQDGKPGGAERELFRWDVDLSDMADNAARFDPATRTYRFQLGFDRNVSPDWLLTLRDRDGEGAKLKVTLQAVLGPAPGGAANVLSDQRQLWK